MVVLRSLALAGLIALASGCAHMKISKDTTPAELLASVCEPGSSVRETKGSVWLKAKSDEASGQFPAMVKATAPDSLYMEVTNLLGGTEARIKVSGRQYTVEVPGKPEQDYKGYGNWGGIPLRWAADLFLGRFPCPEGDPGSLDATVTDEGELVVVVPATLGGDREEFHYRFRKWGGKPWPESLSWKREGPFGTSVEFEFDQPEDETRSPLKWEARSARGEVRMRWKQRNLDRAKS